MSRSISVTIARCASAIASRYSCAPPTTNTSSVAIDGSGPGRAASAIASRSVVALSQSGRDHRGSRLTTMVRRPGSGFPIDSNVLRPITIACPIVVARKCLRSPGSRQGSPLSTPMTPPRARATTIVTRGAVAPAVSALLVSLSGMVMGLYERSILPRLVDAACGSSSLARTRALVVHRARGRVLEVGFGSGLNLPFYDPDEVERVLALEPGDGIRALAMR